MNWHLLLEVIEDFSVILLLIIILIIAKAIKNSSAIWKINKNIYNWIKLTNFGKSTVLLNAISNEKEKDFLQKQQPWTNFKRINNFFVDMDKEELSLIKDYLEKTNRRYGAFQDKYINLLLTVPVSFASFYGIINFISEGNIHSLAISIILLFIIVSNVSKYETERNIRETLLMFIDRAENEKRVRVPVEKSDKDHQGSMNENK